jgi:GNAT superfamily N-acetyltransferase
VPHGGDEMAYRIITIDKRPDLKPQVHRLNPTVWPEFMLHDPVSARYWRQLFRTFAPFQITLCDENDSVVGTGSTIPLYWDGTEEGLPAGWDAALEAGFACNRDGVKPTAICGLSASVARSHQGQGLSSMVVRTMKSIAVENGLKAFIAPVRPTLKSTYPLIPMERYIQWKHRDGSPFDPWLHVHWRLGGRFMKIAPKSMVITGSIQEWEEWANMRFPESGSYIIPGALQPVEVDCDRDEGRYEDPNVWMQHRI